VPKEEAEMTDFQQVMAMFGCIGAFVLFTAWFVTKLPAPPPEPPRLTPTRLYLMDVETEHLRVGHMTDINPQGFSAEEQK